jgi:hypothetical protein
LKNIVERIKCWVDHDKRETKFQVGYMVFLKLGRDNFKLPSGIDGALLQWFEEMFKVLHILEMSPTYWSY